MRITIDTNDAAPIAALHPSAAPDSAAPADSDGGSGADLDTSQAADSSPDTDAGGPPDWLLAAVGATPSASEAADRQRGLALPDDSDSSVADAGGGPAAAPGDLV